VKQMFEAGCKAAHIPYGRKHKGGRLTFHGLRHSATRLVEAGVPLRIVQELGGWKSMRQLEP
jgi:integrase